MNHDWKIKEKDLYLPKAMPVLVDIPKMKFFIIDGEGDPNTSEEFSMAIQALYGLSYGIKMMPKKGIIPKGYFDYKVYPLEGIWDMKVDETTDFTKLDKNNFIYRLMIRQPDFVDEELAKEIIDITKKKKPNRALDKVKFETIEDGLCVQMMHIGSFDDEAESFAKIASFCQEKGYRRTDHRHREIYLSDFRKVSKNKLKTAIRVWVEKV